MNQKLIATILNEYESEVDPRHVEAAMRSEFGTLDHLPYDTFVDFVFWVGHSDNPHIYESLAQSYGL